MSTHCVKSLLAMLLIGGALFGGSAAAEAHPVPRSAHDRLIAVQVTADFSHRENVVSVYYRLEVDELTVVLEDMIPFRDEVQFDRFKNKPMDFFGEYTRIYAPILARNLIAKGNGQPLVFKCEGRTVRRTDEYGAVLGHLRCDFLFRASFPARVDKVQSLTFRESNFELKSGQIRLMLGDRFGFELVSTGNSSPATADQAGVSGLRIVSKTAPDAALQAKSPQELAPGDDDKLRELAVEFDWDGAPTIAAGNGLEKEGDAKSPARSMPTSDDAKSSSNSAGEAESSKSGLLDLLLTSKHGIFVFLLLSAMIGAAHALTPGHGKTLVAAYLVGQRGTVGDACILGVVTALTHTGAVFLLAVALLFCPEQTRQTVANVLGFGMGIALVCLGVWLFLQRLAGRVDHVHFGKHGHHHGPPIVHEESSAEKDETGRRVGWAGLIVMGMTGGIVPCWDAVAMLGWGIAMNLLWMAIPMLIAFSAGLAGVLVLVGILVVHARKMLDSRWSSSRVVCLLPIVSALFIAGMGMAVCYESVHEGANHDHDPQTVAASPH